MTRFPFNRSLTAALALFAAVVGARAEMGMTPMYLGNPFMSGWVPEHAPVLRGVARYAGVHIYDDAGDVVYATRNLLAIHSAAGGTRSLSLPEKVEVMYDLFEDRLAAEDTNHFEVVLKPASTTLYYTGPRRGLP